MRDYNLSICSFLNCRNALLACNNDVPTALEYLKEQAAREGWAKAQKYVDNEERRFDAYLLHAGWPRHVHVKASSLAVSANVALVVQCWNSIVKPTLWRAARKHASLLLGHSVVYSTAKVR